MQIYVVKQGDNVDDIAKGFGISTEILVYDNQIEPPYRLAVGQALLIQGEENLGIRRTIVSGGYAYPYIEEPILNETMPYISELYIFSYGFTEEGNLIPPKVDDQWMINTAHSLGTRPYLTLTPLGPNGSFNNQLIHIAVGDLKIQQQIITELLATVLQRGFGGVDIDFEYILAEDRVPYAEFVKRVRIIMNQFGYPVSVALAPKTSADQPGLLYEGKDYRLLGEAANHVLLMTYEWGYTYSAPMAVAPINMVQKVVEYALTEIPPEKISLGIPNYGYDWTLPYVKGTTKAESLGNIEAVKRAIEFGAVIQFDQLSQTPFYRYWQYGIQHEVWFEDVRSISAKFRLIEDYSLRGAGYWQLMRLFRPNWILMSDTFQILK